MSTSFKVVGNVKVVENPTLSVPFLWMKYDGVGVRVRAELGLDKSHFSDILR